MFKLNIVLKFCSVVYVGVCTSWLQQDTACIGVVMFVVYMFVCACVSNV